MISQVIQDGEERCCTWTGCLCLHSTRVAPTLQRYLSASFPRLVSQPHHPYQPAISHREYPKQQHSMAQVPQSYFTLPALNKPNDDWATAECLGSQQNRKGNGAVQTQKEKKHHWRSAQSRCLPPRQGRAALCMGPEAGFFHFRAHRQGVYPQTRLNQLSSRSHDSTCWQSGYLQTSLLAEKKVRYSTTNCGQMECTTGSVCQLPGRYRVRGFF
ncbi:hypothetical protein DFH27DRAFT_121591 [Peziza echinospora]|nr:hypothetical protein DFH27DRAFT_121591 [Peziza echinospora]